MALSLTPSAFSLSEAFGAITRVEQGSGEMEDTRGTGSRTSLGEDVVLHFCNLGLSSFSGSLSLGVSLHGKDKDKRRT